jgi:hypothetical protein
VLPIGRSRLNQACDDAASSRSQQRPRGVRAQPVRLKGLVLFQRPTGERVPQWPSNGLEAFVRLFPAGRKGMEWAAQTHAQHPGARVLDRDKDERLGVQIRADLVFAPDSSDWKHESDGRGISRTKAGTDHAEERVRRAKRRGGRNAEVELAVAADDTDQGTPRLRVRGGSFQRPDHAMQFSHGLGIGSPQEALKGQWRRRATSPYHYIHVDMDLGRRALCARNRLVPVARWNRRRRGCDSGLGTRIR